MGRIERGGGDGGEPARSPPGRPRFRRPHGWRCPAMQQERACRSSAMQLPARPDLFTKKLNLLVLSNDAISIEYDPSVGYSIQGSRN